MENCHLCKGTGRITDGYIYGEKVDIDCTRCTILNAIEKNKTKLPTMDELIGIDKFNLTQAQRHDCRSLANHSGSEAAIKQASIFESKNKKAINSKPV